MHNACAIASRARTRDLSDDCDAHGWRAVQRCSRVGARLSRHAGHVSGRVRAASTGRQLASAPEALRVSQGRSMPSLVRPSQKRVQGSPADSGHRACLLRSKAARVVALATALRQHCSLVAAACLEASWETRTPPRLRRSRRRRCRRRRRVASPTAPASRLQQARACTMRPRHCKAAPGRRSRHARQAAAAALLKQRQPVQQPFQSRLRARHSPRVLACGPSCHLRAQTHGRCRGPRRPSTRSAHHE
jgi:hypothetical protein